MDKLISVVIPTHNNHREKNFSLGYTLKSLTHQTNQNIEVIVVNDRCTDKTIQKAKEIKPDISIVEDGSASKNLGKLRNIGAEKSNGNIIVFLDDDTILRDPNILDHIIKLLEIYDFTCGAKRYWSSPYWYKNVMLDQSISSIINTLMDISILPMGINKNIGFRDLNEFSFIGSFGALTRDVFFNSGGFNEGFTGWGLEDTEYMMRLCWSSYKYKIMYDLDVSVIHLSHPSDDKDDYLKNLEKFYQIEREIGRAFHINHFFGVYEADGCALFTDIS